MPKNPIGGTAGPDEPSEGPLQSGDQRRGADRRTAEFATAAPASAGASAGPTPGGTTSGGAPIGIPVAERKKRFLVAPRQPHGGALGMQALGIAPLSLSSVQQALQAAPEIDVVDTVGKRGTVGMMAAGMGGAEGVLVARMTDQTANALHQQGQGRLLVERDQHLRLLESVPRQPELVTSLIPFSGPTVEVTIMVFGTNGTPLADAEVSLFGGLLPSTTVTDANGRATLTLYGESPHAVNGLYVKPRTDYWSFYQRDPALSVGEPNVVNVHALADWPVLQNFPRNSALGWGERAMRLDQLPPGFRGKGVKIAVIDSGAATTHGNLNRIRAGFDIINKQTNPNSWNQDELGHGSHCAGVIGGADPAYGIQGFAPEAEIHVCKLFPGGQISQLIEALEYCIEHQIDVVNLSLGGTDPSEALEQQILRAKNAGVACIAAAGNSGGAVQYPASSPNVLAVAAIGKLDEFPRDSYHAETITANIDAQGYFSAKFSCFGPQVDVCAPGVAIVSSVPPNNFAAWDGTSMAAPHVTGLAALVLAHHPEFQGQMRTAERVERLFQLIRLSARRVSLGDPTRIGYGMPDALSALSLSLSSHAYSYQSMLGSLMGMAPQGGMAAGVGGQGYAPVAAQAMMPFGIGPGGLRPQGW